MRHRKAAAEPGVAGGHFALRASRLHPHSSTGLRPWPPAESGEAPRPQDRSISSDTSLPHLRNPAEPRLCGAESGESLIGNGAVSSHSTAPGICTEYPLNQHRIEHVAAFSRIVHPLAWEVLLSPAAEREQIGIYNNDARTHPVPNHHQIGHLRSPRKHRGECRLYASFLSEEIQSFAVLLRKPLVAEQYVIELAGKALVRAQMCACEILKTPEPLLKNAVGAPPATRMNA